MKLLSRFWPFVLMLISLHIACAMDGQDSISDIKNSNSADSKSNVSTGSQYYPLKNFTFDEGSKILAVEYYPLAKNNKATTWDHLDDFGQELDQGYFKNTSKKALWAGVVFACLGAIVPHPACGYVMYRTGDFLKVPISSVESKALISWVVITTTPIFALQFYKFGKRIINCIFHEDPFQPTMKEGDSKPRIFTKDRIHQFTNFLLFGSSAINAAIPTILMREAERDFPMFVSITALPFYFAWLENNYRIGYSNLNHLFRFYKYTSRVNHHKRELLKQRIGEFQKAIQKNDKFVTQIFEAIENQKNNYSNTEGNVFAFSTLFMKSAFRMEAGHDGADESAALLTNFKIDLDAHPSSLTDDFLSWSSTFITGAGIYTRYWIYQDILGKLLVEFGVSPESALIASTVVAAFEGSYRVLTSQYVQSEYFKKFKNIFNLNTSLPALRKGVRVSSLVNATLFSLPTLIAGLSLLKDYPIVSKVAYLSPCFILDFTYYDSFFNSHYNKFIDSVFTLKSKNIGIISKRAHLNSYAEKAYRLIDEFDGETIEKLYAILQKGL